MTQHEWEVRQVEVIVHLVAKKKGGGKLFSVIKAT